MPSMPRFPIAFCVFQLLLLSGATLLPNAASAADTATRDAGAGCASGNSE